jgi:hypothetical protein
VFFFLSLHSSISPIPQSLLLTATAQPTATLTPEQQLPLRQTKITNCTLTKPEPLITTSFAATTVTAPPLTAKPPNSISIPGLGKSGLNLGGGVSVWR